MGEISARIAEKERLYAAIDTLKRLVPNDKALADLLWEMVNAIREAKSE